MGFSWPSDSSKEAAGGDASFQHRGDRVLDLQLQGCEHQKYFLAHSPFDMLCQGLFGFSEILKRLGDGTFFEVACSKHCIYKKTFI